MKRKKVALKKYSVLERFNLQMYTVVTLGEISTMLFITD